MSKWTCVLKLNSKREVIAGSAEQLADAVRHGGDICCYTTFDYAEHMNAEGSTEGLVQEAMNFGPIYLLDDSHVAGIQTTRYPANCSLGLFNIPSLSLFLNNDSGNNGVARLFLGGRDDQDFKVISDKPEKYKTIDTYDCDTLCPSENFTYEFDEYCWWTKNSWEEVLSHNADGSVTHGSLGALQAAFREGRDIKVGVSDLCSDLVLPDSECIKHEVFVMLHSIYNHQDSGFLGGQSEPMVRVAPDVPLKYKSGNWDYAWILPRTDGVVHMSKLNPLTREFKQVQGRYPVRWFVR